MELLEREDLLAALRESLAEASAGRVLDPYFYR
jgi:hypothetical protein